MQRRAFLSAAGAVGVTLLAGCATVTGEPEVEYEANYESFGGTFTEGRIFVYGEVSNSGSVHVDVLEMTATVSDEAGQEITSRSKRLTDLRTGTTQEFYFRIGLSAGEMSDFGDIDIDVEPVETSASLASL